MSSTRRQFFEHGLVAGGGLLAGSVLAAVPADAAPAPNETLRVIAGLRTIHGNFTARAIPDGDLQQVVAASVRAANASAMQSYSIIVVKDPAVQKKVCGYSGSCLLLYAVDYNRNIATAKRLGHQFSPDDMEWFVTGTMNTMLAAQTAAIAAKSLGIDSLLTNGVHRGDMARHWDTLGLPPKFCFPLIALVLGYAAEEPKYRTGRLSGPGVVHQGQYHALTDAEADGLVRQYDDKSQHLGLNETWDQNGHKHYLDWFHTEWSKRKQTTGPSQMLTVLKRTGFVEDAWPTDRATTR
jgi:nitroreductase